MTCRKLVLGIGIATIVIYAAFYAFLKSRSDSESIESEIGVQISELFDAKPFALFLLVLLPLVLLPLVAILTVSAYEAVMLDGKKAVEAERVQLLQELCRDTKSDASLAIPVAPFTCIRSPSATVCSAVLDAVSGFIVGDVGVLPTLAMHPTPTPNPNPNPNSNPNPDPNPNQGQMQGQQGQMMQGQMQGQMPHQPQVTSPQHLT